MPWMQSLALAAVAALLSAAAPLWSDDEPRLVLNAPRVQSILPGLAAKGYGKRVDVRAELEGDPADPEAYYCLDEVWEWGDGTESVREPDCDPYEPGTELKRRFSETHYFRPGQYFITLRLMHLDETVVKGTIEIRIY